MLLQLMYPLILFGFYFEEKALAKSYRIGCLEKKNKKQQGNIYWSSSRSRKKTICGVIWYTVDLKHFSYFSHLHFYKKTL